MKDLLLSSMRFQSRNYLVFYPSSLILYQEELCPYGSGTLSIGVIAVAYEERLFGRYAQGFEHLFRALLRRLEPA